MDLQPWQWWLTTSFAFLGAALGATTFAIAEVRRRRYAPTLLLTFSVTKPWVGLMRRERELGFIVQVKNEGNEPVTNVRVLGGGVRTGPLQSKAAGARSLDPGEGFSFTAEPTDDSDTAWVVLMFTSRSVRRGHNHVIWQPWDPDGPLGEHRRKQLLAGPFRTALVRWAGRDLASPSTLPVGSLKVDERNQALWLRDGPRPLSGPTGWLRTLILKRVVAAPEFALITRPPADR